MPIYEYYCQSCNEHFEMNQNMSAPKPPCKPGCSSTSRCHIEKKISPFFGRTITRGTTSPSAGPAPKSSREISREISLETKTTAPTGGHTCSKYCGSHHGN